jgi:hypothetical protein
MTVVRWIRAVVGFWVDFVIGDDWTVAATVLAGLLGTWGLVGAGLPAWWLLPAAVIGIITLSLRRAVRPARRPVSSR